MEVLNATVFRVGAIPSRLNFPGHSVTFVVKGTFDLVSDGVAEEAQEQPLLAADEPFPDDEEAAGAPRFPSDFAPIKPNSDIVFAGRAFAPGGKPVARLEAEIAIDDWRRALLVLGDRHWKASFIGGGPSETTPFTEMELRYERSFGGAKHAANPIGAGHHARQDDPVPNLAWVENQAEQSEPAGFGPLSPEWQFRRKKIGKVKKKWVKTRWPWFPEGFDPTYFNSAPPAMQIPGHLRGDESIELVNLHPEHARLRTKLPSLRVRCLAERVSASRPGDTSAEPEFLEVDMKLDTLFIDGDTAQVSLVWRGHTEVDDEDFEDIQRVFVAAESLAEEPASAEEVRESVPAAVTQAEEDESIDEDQNEAPEAVEPPTDAPPIERIEDDEETLRLQKEIDDAKKSIGIEGDGLPKLAATERLDVIRLLTVLGVPPADIASTTGFPASEIPADTPAEIVRRMQLCKKLGISPDIPEPEPEPEPEEEPTPPPRTRESVVTAVAAGESLEDEDLSGLDLSGLDLRGAILEGASLRNAKLVGADLSEAQLSRADLGRADLSSTQLIGTTAAEVSASGARFVDANLTGADLSDSDLSFADFSRATAEDAVFQSASLAQAVFVEARVADADFVGADMTKTDLTSARLDGADLSGSTLDHAVFRGASMVEASLNGARGVEVVLAETDLTRLRASDKAILPGLDARSVRGEGAKFDSAVLDGADFSGSSLENASFSKASLAAADFTGSKMRFARFRKANLVRAKLVTANLFECIFERADLTGADLSGSSLYQAEFLEAKVDDIRTEGTNLKMTKLA